MSARGAAIVLDKLSVAGRDGLRPCDLSAVIEPGQVTVLTGANGAGKTTTLQVIAGITAATSGRVTVAGVEIADLEPTAWWQQLSWLPQRPVLIPGTVADNLALFGALADTRKRLSRHLDSIRAGRAAGRYAHRYRTRRRRAVAGSAATPRLGSCARVRGAGAAARRADRPPGRRDRSPGAAGHRRTGPRRCHRRRRRAPRTSRRNR